MAQTSINIAKAIDGGVLEGQLRAKIAKAVSVYVTGTNAGRAIWPDGLTAPETTTANSVIAAHTVPPPDSRVVDAEAYITQATAYLATPTPTTAQNTAALKNTVRAVRALVQLTLNRMP